MALIELVKNKKIVENLVIPKGVDYEQLFVIRDKQFNRPIDFSGFSSSIVTSKIKQYSESISFAATFTASFSDASNGVVKLTLTNSETNELKTGRYFYDVVVIVESKPSADVESNLQTIRLVEGGVVVV